MLKYRIACYLYPVNYEFMNIIITGASKGIGYAIANAFAASGHNLYLTSKTPADLANAAEALQKTFPSIKVEFVHADLSVKPGQ